MTEIKDKLQKDFNDFLSIINEEPMENIPNEKCDFLADWITDNLTDIKIDEELVEHILGLVDSFNRWEMFKYLCDYTFMTPAAKGRAFGFAYTNGKCDLDDFDYYLEGIERKYIMNKEEMSYFNSLPDMVTIYRGTSTDEFENKEYGTSWTVNPNVAEFFAYNYTMTKDEGERCVLQTQVPKDNIIAYLNDREEYEVLIREFPNEITRAVR